MKVPDHPSNFKNLYFWFYLVLAITLAISPVIWARFAQGLPDVDALKQVLNPVQLALGMIHQGWDFTKIQNYLPVGSYPPAANLFAHVIYELGVHELHDNRIYFLSLFYTLPLVILWPRFTRTWKHACWSIVLLFSFPVLLLCFRSLSWHSFNTVYALLGTLLFLRWLEQEKRIDLFLSLLFWTMAVALKHLGILHLLSLLFALYLCSNSKTITRYFLLTIPLIAGCSFYLLNPSFYEYIDSTLLHNPQIRVLQWILIPAVFLAILCLNKLKSFLYPNFRNFPLSSGWIALSLTFLSFLFYPLFFFFDQFHQLWTSTVTPLIIAVILIPFSLLIATNLKESSRKRILLVSAAVQWILSTFLFFSSLGFLHAVFQWSILLIFCEWLRSSQISWKSTVCLLIFLYWGNFFPGKSSIDSSAKLAFLMNSSTHNYWNWCSQPYLNLRGEFKNQIHRIHLDSRESFNCLAPDLDHFQDAILNLQLRLFHKMYNFRCEDQIPTEELKSWLDLSVEQLHSKVAFLIIDSESARTMNQNELQVIEKKISIKQIQSRHLEPEFRQKISRLLGSRILQESHPFIKITRTPSGIEIWRNSNLKEGVLALQSLNQLLNEFEVINSVERDLYWSALSKDAIDEAKQTGLFQQHFLRILKTDFKGALEDYLQKMSLLFPKDKGFSEVLELLERFSGSYPALSQDSMLPKIQADSLQISSPHWQKAQDIVVKMLIHKWKLTIINTSKEQLSYWKTCLFLKEFERNFSLDAIQIEKGKQLMVYSFLFPTDKNRMELVQTLETLGFQDISDCLISLKESISSTIPTQLTTLIPALGWGKLSLTTKGHSSGGQDCLNTDELKLRLSNRIEEVLIGKSLYENWVMKSYKVLYELSPDHIAIRLLSKNLQEMSLSLLESRSASRINHLLPQYAWLNETMKAVYKLFEFRRKFNQKGLLHPYPSVDFTQNSTVRGFADLLARYQYELSSQLLEENPEQAILTMISAILIYPEHQNSLSDIESFCSMGKDLENSTRLLSLINPLRDNQDLPDRLNSCINMLSS